MFEKQENPEIRVTDRRRINLTDSDTERSGDEPNLKPSYVESLEAKVREAEQRTNEIQARFDQLKQQLQRETDETRKRLNRAADERTLAARGDFIASLLPVLDNLIRAIEAAEKSTENQSLLEGLERTADGFRNALISAGVEVVHAVGTTFDPELHEAVDMTEVDESRNGTVIAEYSPGYRLGTRLLRPARVQVGKSVANHQTAE
jgi:molecular chaperone GrpE